MIKIDGMRTKGTKNAREHYMARARRVRAERKWANCVLRTCDKPATPCVVTLTRCAPSAGLDDDNLCGSLSGVRDQVAEWIGVDDRHRHIVRYQYEQRRGPWAVEISIEAMPS